MTRPRSRAEDTRTAGVLSTIVSMPAALSLSGDSLASMGYLDVSLSSLSSACRLRERQNWTLGASASASFLRANGSAALAPAMPANMLPGNCSIATFSSITLSS